MNPDDSILQDADWTEREEHEELEEIEEDLEAEYGLDSVNSCYSCGAEGIILSESSVLSSRESYGKFNAIWYSSFAQRWMCERCQSL